MATILLAIGLVLTVEGLAYALAPSFFRDLAEQLRRLGDDQLRFAGLTAAIAGAIIVWVASRLA